MKCGCIVLLLACVVSCVLALGPPPLDSERARDVLATTCSKLECAVRNGRCGVDGSSLSMCIPGSQYCKEGTCTDFIKENEVCQNNGPENQCGGLICQQSDSSQYVCLPVVYRNDPGEDCSSDSQCYYKNITMQTTNSTCVSGKCQGQNIGEMCDSEHGQCLVGLFCNTTASACMALGALGDACDSRIQCASGSCLPSDVNASGHKIQGEKKTCVSSQYITEHGACENTDDCVIGLYCYVPSGGNMWGKCTKVGPSSYNNCTTDSDCTLPESCTCNSVSGALLCMTPPVRSQQLVAAEEANNACATKHNCNSNECILRNCGKELCTYNSIMYGPTVWNANITGLECVYGEMVIASYAKCNSGSLEKVTSDAQNTYLCILPVLTLFMINLVVFLAM